MNSRSVGKRALAALLSTALLTSGVVTLAPDVAAQTVSVTGKSPRGKVEGSGNGTLTTAGTVAPGGLLTVSGTGFDRRPDEDGSLAFKINDGDIKFTADQEGSDVVDVDDRGTAYFGGEQLPDADGSFTGTVRIPSDLAPGDYWIRLLAGADGGESASKYAWFTVAEEAAPTEEPSQPSEPAEPSQPSEPSQPAEPSQPSESAEPSEPAEPSDPEAPAAEGTLSAEPSSATASGVNAGGFKPGEEITATVNGQAAKFGTGRRATESAAANDEGVYTGTVSYALGVVPAGETGEIVLTGASGTVAKATVTGRPQISVETDAGRSPALGSKAAVTVENLSDGDKVVAVGEGDQNFLTEAQADNAASENKVELSDVAIPNDQQLLGKELQVTVEHNGNAVQYGSGQAFTPSNASFGEDQFSVVQNKLPAGLYQAAYSATENAVYVTRAVGRPPVKQSTLYKLNADTLEEIGHVDAAVQDESTGGRWAVYGVDVDDSLGQVWVTNTRQNTVAVYNASDLSLIKQFDAGLVPHGRDVQVDQQADKVFVSAPTSERNGLYAFDAKTLEPLGEIDLGDFAGPMALDFDQATGNLYSVALNSPKVVKVETRNGNKVTSWTYSEDEIDRGSGVAFDSKNQRLHVTSQGSSNDLVVDANTGKVIKNIPTGAGAINAAYNAEDNVVYVSNFGANTVTAIDADTLEPIANLDAGRSVNHVVNGRGGNVYAVSKGSVKVGEENYNLVSKINKGGEEPAGPTQPTEEPGKPSEPSEPSKPSDEPGKPSEPSKPSEEPGKPSEPSKPSEEPGKPSEPSKPAPAPSKPGFALSALWNFTVKIVVNNPFIGGVFTFAASFGATIKAWVPAPIRHFLGL